jgi:hypothetical protein
VAPSGSSSNNYQPLKTSRVTTIGTAADTANAIDTATDSETATTTATSGFMRKP